MGKIATKLPQTTSVIMLCLLAFLAMRLPIPQVAAASNTKMKLKRLPVASTWVATIAIPKNPTTAPVICQIEGRSCNHIVAKKMLKNT